MNIGDELARLEGRFDDNALENTAHNTAIALGRGDDKFVQTTYSDRQWFAPFVDAANGNVVFQTSGSLDMFTTQDGLIARTAG